MMKSETIVVTTGFMMLLSIAATGSAQTFSRREPPKAMLSLEDQFERKQDIAQYRGDVVVILYSDKGGSPACKELGEQLHVHYHPTAKGLTPGEASKAPVTPVAGLKEGARSPEVRVVPVACIGKAPDLIKNYLRGRIKKEAPDSIVLLDFENKMKTQFGLKEGEPNLIVVDSLGRLRMKVAGDVDVLNYLRVVQAIDILRKEAAEK